MILQFYLHKNLLGTLFKLKIQAPLSDSLLLASTTESGPNWASFGWSVLHLLIQQGSALSPCSAFPLFLSFSLSAKFYFDLITLFCFVVVGLLLFECHIASSSTKLWSRFFFFFLQFQKAFFTQKNKCLICLT